jgi:hypothetical protein
MQALGFLALGIELLAGPIEVVNYRQNFTEGGAGDLEAQIILVTALAFTEVVEVCGDAHVLALEALVFGLQGLQSRIQVG